MQYLGCVFFFPRNHAGDEFRLAFTTLRLLGLFSIHSWNFVSEEAHKADRIQVEVFCAHLR